MFTYEPFRATIKEKNLSSYKLIKFYNISPSLLHKLNHDLPINITTLDRLCDILKVNIEDICCHVAK